MAEGSARGSVERLEPAKATRAASRRVAESKATIPHVYADLPIGVTDGDDLLARVVCAAARALRDVPELNGAYRDGAAERYSRVNVGVAVAGPDALVFPTIFDADRKDADATSAELASLTAAAGDGSLTAAQLAGGTFTVQTAEGARSFVPVIAGAQAANLGVGGVVDGQLIATVAADARMVDGSSIGRFLQAMRRELGDGA